jgi:hypothetical protein
MMGETEGDAAPEAHPRARPIERGKRRSFFPHPRLAQALIDLVVNFAQERTIVRPALSQRLELPTVGAELLEVGDDIGDVVVGRQPRKNHLGPGHLFLRVLQIDLEGRFVPGESRGLVGF